MGYLMESSAVQRYENGAPSFRPVSPFESYDEEDTEQTEEQTEEQTGEQTGEQPGELNGELNWKRIFGESQALNEAEDW
jgi:hypothetical protein